MADVLIIENDKLNAQVKGIEQTVSLFREELSFFLESGSKKVLNLSVFIENKESMDFTTKFVIYEGEFYILWRETYQNQSNEQGLLSFNSGRVFEYCRGQYGLDYD